MNYAKRMSIVRRPNTIHMKKVNKQQDYFLETIRAKGFAYVSIQKSTKFQNCKFQSTKQI